MEPNHKVTLALLVGALTGFAGTEVIHAQQTKPLLASPYVIAEEDVKDAATFQKYSRTGSPRNCWRHSMATM